MVEAIFSFISTWKECFIHQLSGNLSSSHSHVFIQYLFVGHPLLRCVIYIITFWHSSLWEDPALGLLPWECPSNTGWGTDSTSKGIQTKRKISFLQTNEIKRDELKLTMIKTRPWGEKGMIVRPMVVYIICCSSKIYIKVWASTMKWVSSIFLVWQKSLWIFGASLVRLEERSCNMWFMWFILTTCEQCSSSSEKILLREKNMIHLMIKYRLVSSYASKVVCFKRNGWGE